MATAEALTIEQGDYLTNGKDLILVMRVGTDGSLLAEDARTLVLFYIACGDATKWEKVIRS